MRGLFRTILLVVLLALGWSSATAQLLRVRETNGKYGYKRSGSSSWAIPPKFDVCPKYLSTSDNYFVAKKGFDYYSYTKDGVELSAIGGTPTTRNITFSKDAVKSGCDLFVITYYNKKKGVSNVRGEFILPAIFDHVYIAHGKSVNLFLHKIYAVKDGALMIFDLQGRPLKQPYLGAKIQNIKQHSVIHFGKGKENAGILGVKANGKWGIMSSAGKLLTKFEFDEIRRIDDILSVVKKGDRFAVLTFDKGGKMAILNNRYYDEVDCRGKYIIVKEQGRYGSIACDGSIIQPIKAKKSDKVVKKSSKLVEKKMRGLAESARSAAASLAWECGKQTTAEFNKKYSDKEVREYRKFYAKKAAEAKENNWTDHRLWYLYGAAIFGHHDLKVELGEELFNKKFAAKGNSKYGIELLQLEKSKNNFNRNCLRAMCYQYGDESIRDKYKALEYALIAYSVRQLPQLKRDIALIYMDWGTIGDYKTAAELLKGTEYTDLQSTVAKKIKSLESRIPKMKTVELKEFSYTNRQQYDADMAALNYFNKGDYAKVLKYAKPNAELGTPTAMLLVAGAYDYLGYKKQSIIWLHKLLKVVIDPDPVYDMLACNYKYIKDYKNAIKYCKILVDKGYPDAYNEYELLLSKTGAKESALIYAEKGANLGVSVCAYNIYNYNANKSIGYRLRYLLQAALCINGEFRHEAQFNIGYMMAKSYANGAIYWYQQSAKGGIKLAYLHLGYMYRSNKYECENEKESFKYFLKSIDDSIPVSYYEVAWCYLAGRGVEANPTLGMKYLDKACSFKVNKAYILRAYCNTGAMGVKKNIAKAKYYLNLAKKPTFEEDRAGLLLYSMVEILLEKEGCWTKK